MNPDHAVGIQFPPWRYSSHSETQPHRRLALHNNRTTDMSSMTGSKVSPVAPGARVQPPPPLSLGASEGGAVLKVAVTVASLVSEQGPVPAQSPLHPTKTDPGSDAAARVAVLPWGNCPLHVAPQSIPAELDVTVPVPAPALLTVTVKFATTLTNAARALMRPPVDTFPLKEVFLSTVLRMAFLTWDMVRLGLTESNKPASPATCGVAIDVPARN